jgi:uncharacterized protein (DUF302 family)
MIAASLALGAAPTQRGSPAGVVKRGAPRHCWTGRRRKRKGAGMAVEGLITSLSKHGPKETMDRLEAEVKAKGMTVFARVDHAAGAREAGLALRPTELLMFGNAKGGTPLMQACQSIGIDLPLKALVWQDEAGATWLSYNDPAWLARRHGAAATVAPALPALSAALAALARVATEP